MLTTVNIEFNPDIIDECSFFESLSYNTRIIILLQCLLRDFNKEKHNCTIKIRKMDKYLIDIMSIECPEYLCYSDSKIDIKKWILANGKKVDYTVDPPMYPMAYETSSGDRYYY